MKIENIFNFNYLAIVFLLLGYFFVNFVFLEDDIRQVVAYSFFFIAIIFSLKSNVLYLMSGKLSLNHVIGLFILAYAVLVTYFYGSVDEYGQNKFQYFLFIIFLAFIAMPQTLNDNNKINQFVFLFVVVSLAYCFIAIFFAASDGARRGDSGLNPAILARLCMLTGLYGLVRVYVDGVTIQRVGLIIISCVAVFMTGTKTPFPVAVLTYFIVTFKKDNLLLLIKSVSVVLVICLISYLSLKYIVPESISSRILDLDSLSFAAQSKEGNRFELYGLAFHIIANEPQGLGFGGFVLYHRFILVPHNVFLENAVEMGIVSAIFFMTWAFYIFRLTMKCKSKNADYLFVNAMFVYMLISSMFGGEATMQSLFLYLSGSIILLNHKKFDRQL